MNEIHKALTQLLNIKNCNEYYNSSEDRNDKLH